MINSRSFLLFRYDFWQRNKVKGLNYFGKKHPKNTLKYLKLKIALGDSYYLLLNCDKHDKIQHFGKIKKYSI